MFNKALRVRLWLSGVMPIITYAAGATISPVSGDTHELVARYNTMCTSISPPPQNEICGAMGYLHSPESNSPQLPVAGNSSVPQISFCRDLCAVRSEVTGGQCTGFAYRASTGLCVLYNKPLFTQGFEEDAGSPFQFYSQDCFRCPKRCPHPPKANIIDNGGFEFSKKLIGPWFAYGGQPEVVSPGFHSARALKAQDILYLIQSRDICSGHIYSFSVDIKIVKHPSSSNITLPTTLSLHAGQIRIEIEYPDIYSNSSLVNYGSWRTFRGTTKGRTTNAYGLATTDFRVTFDNSRVPNAYPIYVDNFIFKPASGKYQTVGPNLLTNGGFESGELAPWQTESIISNERGSDSHPPNDNKVVPYGLTSKSNYSYLYNVDEYEQPFSYEYCPNGNSNSCGGYYHNPAAGDDLGGVNLFQTFDTIPGQLYLISLVYRAKNVNAITIRILDGNFTYTSFEWDVLFDVYDEGYTQVYQGSSNSHYDYPVSSDKVATFSRVFEALVPRSQLDISFAGFGYNAAANDIIQIDDVSILALAEGQGL